MAIITLLTDSGKSDHYVAAMKATILSLNSAIKIVDISHEVKPFDIAHGAFILKSVFHDFPRGTVHMVAIGSVGHINDSFIALQWEDYFFVGVDNGLFGLISDTPHQNAVNLGSVKTLKSTFPEKKILAIAAAKLAGGIALTSLGSPVRSFKKMTNRQVKATRKEMVGHVIHVDHYGNLITNIQKSEFDILSKGKAFTITLGGEQFRHIHTHYNQVEDGDCCLVFNEQSLLEIAVNKGHANKLLGLQYDSIVHIKFED